MNKTDFINKLNAGFFDEKLSVLYGRANQAVERQRERYKNAVGRFSELFPKYEDIHVFSAPGRTEIGGNHTDHQHGCALAAAVNLDIIAVVAFREERTIHFFSEGYGMIKADLDDLCVHEEEYGTSKALIRGIAARFEKTGVNIGGFDAYSVSDVLGGSGLSSSAAFETLVGSIIDIYYNDCRAGELEIAKTGQYAENVYFGKGSGLLDQTVCSVGGFVFIDFEDTENPRVEKYNFDFEAAGYNLCVTDTKGSHSDLTGDYIAVPGEMKRVAEFFGKSVLREVDEKQFFDSLPLLRGKMTDREILRAAHFFGENKRAVAEAEALDNNDIERFFELYRLSARSSAEYLQNLYSVSKPLEQGIPLAIMASRRVLGENAPVRVHGGGFAGTIQAFVPLEKTEEYVEKMNTLFGDGSCYVLRVRPVGGIELK